MPAGSSVDLRVEFTLDVFGNRLAKAVDPDGDGPLPADVLQMAFERPTAGAAGLMNAWADLDGSGSLTTRRLYDGVDALFARIGTTGNEDWYLTDRLGSVRDIVDSAGALQNHIDYSPFGAVLTETNPSYGDRYGFTAREEDPEYGWLHYRARQLDPATGRFTSNDPIGFTAGDANLARYVGNSPTNATDPSGLQASTNIPSTTVPSLPSTGSWHPQPTPFPPNGGNIFPLLPPGQAGVLIEINPGTPLPSGVIRIGGILEGTQHVWIPGGRLEPGGIDRVRLPSGEVIQGWAGVEARVGDSGRGWTFPNQITRMSNVNGGGSISTTGNRLLNGLRIAGRAAAIAGRIAGTAALVAQPFTNPGPGRSNPPRGYDRLTRQIEVFARLVQASAENARDPFVRQHIIPGLMNDLTFWRSRVDDFRSPIGWISPPLHPHDPDWREYRTILVGHLRGLEEVITAIQRNAGENRR